MTEKPPTPKPEVINAAEEVNSLAALLYLLVAGVIVVLTIVAVFWK